MSQNLPDKPNWMRFPKPPFDSIPGIADQWQSEELWGYLEHIEAWRSCWQEAFNRPEEIDYQGPGLFSHEICLFLERFLQYDEEARSTDLFPVNLPHELKVRNRNPFQILCDILWWREQAHDWPAHCLDRVNVPMGPEEVSAAEWILSPEGIEECCELCLLLYPEEERDPKAHRCAVWRRRSPRKHIEEFISGSEGEKEDDAAILIVEDCSQTTELFKHILEKEHLGRIISAADAEEARRRIQSIGRQLHLVVLNLHIPHGDGFQVMQSLSEFSTRPVAVVMVTAIDNPDNRNRFLQAASDTVIPYTFLAKPIQPDKFPVFAYAMDFVKGLRTDRASRFRNRFCGQCGLGQRTEESPVLFRCRHCGSLEEVPVVMTKHDGSCPGCNRPISEGAACCQRCGYFVSPSLLHEVAQRTDICMECRSPNSADSTYCITCRYPLKGLLNRDPIIDLRPPHCPFCQSGCRVEFISGYNVWLCACGARGMFGEQKGHASLWERFARFWNADGIKPDHIEEKAKLRLVFQRFPNLKPAMVGFWGAPRSITLKNPLVGLCNFVKHGSYQESDWIEKINHHVMSSPEGINDLLQIHEEEGDPYYRLEWARLAGQFRDPGVLHFCEKLAKDGFVYLQAAQEQGMAADFYECLLAGAVMGDTRCRNRLLQIVGNQNHPGLGSDFDECLPLYIDHPAAQEIHLEDLRRQHDWLDEHMQTTDACGRLRFGLESLPEVISQLMQSRMRLIRFCVQSTETAEALERTFILGEEPALNRLEGLIHEHVHLLEKADPQGARKKSRWLAELWPVAGWLESGDREFENQLRRFLAERGRLGSGG